MVSNGTKGVAELDKRIGRQKQIYRFFKIFAPFFLLVIIIGGIQLWPRLFNSKGNIVKTVGTTGFIETVSATDTIVTATAVTVLATPIPATSTPLPTLPPDATIRLIGPPTNSTFDATTSMSLYWQWPLELHEDLSFSVYLIDETQQETKLGTISENNLGKQYFLDVALNHLAIDQNINYLWQVRLEQQSNGKVLIQSETRLLNLS